MGSSESVPVASGDDRQLPKDLKPLHDYCENWNKEMSGTWYNLVREKVRDIVALNPDLDIKKCVVFGLGSLDQALQNQHPLTGMHFIDHTNWEQLASDGNFQPNEVRQFIIVRVTVDCIKEAARPIETYFQDPKFTKLDKAYLSYHGFEVLEDDSGLDELDLTTLVVNLRCGGRYNFWRPALKASPAVYVGPSLQDVINSELVAVKEWKHGEERYSFDKGLFEDYMNLTKSYSFPRSDLQEYNEVYRSLPRPATAISLQLDHWAFGLFEIRVIKTVHKDHKPS